MGDAESVMTSLGNGGPGNWEVEVGQCERELATNL